MTVKRRHLLGAVAFAAATAEAQPEAAVELSEDRRRILEPILEQRRAQLQTLRAFPVDDAVEPSHGCA